MNLPPRFGNLFLSLTLVSFAILPSSIAKPRIEQIIVSTPSSWSSKTAPLQAFERQGNAWVPLFSSPVRIQLARNGSAWGRGILPKPNDVDVAYKREGDGKAPAGMFRLGKVFGYTPLIPGQTNYPYNQVTRWDAWVDDVNNPEYNRHIEILNPETDKIPSWFESQRMRLGDGAYKWMIEIRHNADPKPVPGAGSAIFFHIRRGAERYTSGCSAMQEPHLIELIKWLKPSKNPHYVLLPTFEYKRFAPVWQLPPVE